jgi:hypothetical protein
LIKIILEIETLKAFVPEPIASFKESQNMKSTALPQSSGFSDYSEKIYEIAKTFQAFDGSDLATASIQAQQYVDNSIRRKAESEARIAATIAGVDCAEASPTSHSYPSMSPDDKAHEAIMAIAKDKHISYVEAFTIWQREEAY